MSPPATGEWSPLDATIVTVWRLALGFGLGPPAIGAAVLGAILLSAWRWIPAAVALVMVPAGVWWYPRARYRRWRWCLGDLALDLEYGVLVRRRESIPYFRIQQIDVTRGPLARALGLAALDVTTASASGGASLPGLDAALAPVLRQELLQRTAARAAGTEADDAV
ncbi:MAG: PH domain-containing protein [Nitriliruptoraceae bacterium]